MGYTHYFKQQKNIPTDQWHLLKRKIIELFPHLRKTGNAPYDLPEPVIICNCSGGEIIEFAEDLFQADEAGEFISFNGLYAHEDFILSQTLSDEWFCKTNCKPYDLLVVAILILACNECPDCFDICSDGNEKEWRPVLLWLNHHLASEYRLPQRIPVD